MELLLGGPGLEQGKRQERPRARLQGPGHGFVRRVPARDVVGGGAGGAGGLTTVYPAGIDGAGLGAGGATDCWARGPRVASI